MHFQFFYHDPSNSENDHLGNFAIRNKEAHIYTYTDPADGHTYFAAFTKPLFPWRAKRVLQQFAEIAHIAGPDVVTSVADGRIVLNGKRKVTMRKGKKLRAVITR